MSPVAHERHKDMKVYLSYVHTDETRARRLAELLGGGDVGCHVVLGGRWNRLRAGESFRHPHEQELEAADVILVLLTTSSVTARSLLDEIVSAQILEKVMIPLLLDDVGARTPRLIQDRVGVDMRSWDGDRTDPAFTGLIDGLARLSGG